jgi:nicotinamide mononucleotide transporter
MLQAAVYYRLLIYFNGDRPFLDGILTAASLTATYMMTKKWVENWLAWVLIDVAYVLLYCLKDMWLFALLYFLFAAMALYGWIKWRKTAS